MLNCFKCKKELTLDASQNIPRGETCDSCLADIRCCKMCTFYDPLSYNDCKESSASRIVEKEKGNFCDYYKLKSKSNDDSSRNDIVNLANSLFK